MFSKLPLCLMFCFFLPSVGKVEAKSASQGGISVTGCLKKGNTLDRFTLKAQNGKTYALRSASVKLVDHVGHTVSIKGRVQHDQKRDDYDFEGSEVNEEYGKGKISDPVDVEVFSLKMLGGPCR